MQSECILNENVITLFLYTVNYILKINSITHALVTFSGCNLLVILTFVLISQKILKIFISILWAFIPDDQY